MLGSFSLFFMIVFFFFGIANLKYIGMHFSS